MTRVLGIDVSKRSVCACLLTEKPIEPKQFYYKYAFCVFKADASGIKGILDLKPDVALIEPTGTNYSKLWVTALTQNGVSVKFVGHKELRSYRSSHLNLPDKDDNADALALACYAFDYDSPTRYLTIRDATTAQIRELILRLVHLNRVQSPIINRLRQDLAWQFPEVALVKSPRSRRGELPLLWGWLSNIRESKKYDGLYLDSVGLGLTDTVKLHAERLCHLQQEEYQIEDEISALLQASNFIPYRKAFERFGFGMRTQALLLSQIYPLTNFLNENRKPIVEFHNSRNSNKRQKRRLSERRFQKVMGLAPTQESSGDKKKSKVSGGSALCRRAFWQWVFTSIEPKRSRNNEITKKLGAILDKEKTGGRPIRLIRSRISVRGCKMLFNQLVKELNEYNRC
ncbi:MAG: IS110 family transposase [Richelia sp. RM2_1_2]|nr:IS110 family transposase [Richelia sp. RM1_1_1]NJO60393.1 IS110 family transposase [Richelia sp. RM2_1_2]